LTWNKTVLNLVVIKIILQVVPSLDNFQFPNNSRLGITCLVGSNFPVSMAPSLLWWTKLRMATTSKRLPTSTPRH